MSEMRYGDIEVGQQFEFGPKTVTEDDIIRFAKRYDPQFFHLDPEEAKNSVFGAIVASGWQTASITSRLLVDDVYHEENLQMLAGRGVDELRWHEPVYPDDTLSGTMEIVDKRPSESDSSRGHIEFTVTTRNQNGDAVLTLTCLALVGRSPA